MPTQESAKALVRASAQQQQEALKLIQQIQQERPRAIDWLGNEAYKDGGQIVHTAPMTWTSAHVAPVRGAVSFNSAMLGLVE